MNIIFHLLKGPHKSYILHHLILVYIFHRRLLWKLWLTQTVSYQMASSSTWHSPLLVVCGKLCTFHNVSLGMSISSPIMLPRNVFYFLSHLCWPQSSVRSSIPVCFPGLVFHQLSQIELNPSALSHYHQNTHLLHWLTWLLRSTVYTH